MPHKYPPEFKRDVIAVSRRGGAPQEQIATDFGISTSTLKRWTAQADIDDGVAPGTATAEHDELVALKRRNRVLEQEVEILRRATAYFAKDAAPRMMYPLVRDLAVDGMPVSVTCRVLGFSTQGEQHPVPWTRRLSITRLGLRSSRQHGPRVG